MEPQSGSSIKEFVEPAYPNYVAKRKTFKLSEGLIDGYLDAKAPGDLLEGRAIKLVIVVEMLKAVFLALPEKPIREFILDPASFRTFENPLTHVVRGALQCGGVEGEAIDSICVKIKELNRVSFRRILESMLNLLGLTLDKNELKLFIACRNSLVHSGDFYKASNQERILFYQERPTPEIVELDPHYHGVAEFFFLKNFVDKLILKLLGYSGHYTDARLRSPKHPNPYGGGIL